MEREHKLEGSVAVVTGASAGVGRAVALQLARSKAKIALIGRDLQSLEDVRAEIESRGASALSVAIDVANANEMFAAAVEIEQKLGPIALWINNAMVTVFSPVSELAPHEFRRVTDVTYLGSVFGTMAALRAMRPRDAGTIVQVGSALAYRAIPLQSAYCGAKHAVRAFTDSLRSELLNERSRIRITVVELPAVNTPQFDWARTHMQGRPRPVAPVFQPEVIAEKIVFAAQRPVREYWLGRSTLVTILGSMLLPRLFDRLLARRAIRGQQRDCPVAPTHQDNLFEPVVPLHSSRGSFGREAHDRLVAIPGPLARGVLVASAVAVILAVGFAAGHIAAS